MYTTGTKVFFTMFCFNFNYNTLKRYYMALKIQINIKLTSREDAYRACGRMY